MKKSGQDRVVYVFNNWTIKRTRVNFAGWSCLWSMLVKLDLEGLSMFLRNDCGDMGDNFTIADCFLPRYVLPGVGPNWREFILWWKTRDKFFWPTYFSLGFVSVQPTAVIVDKDIGERRVKLYHGLGKGLLLHPSFKGGRLSHHLKQPDNYCVTADGRLAMVDYGDHIISPITYSEELRRALDALVNETWLQTE